VVASNFPTATISFVRINLHEVNVQFRRLLDMRYRENGYEVLVEWVGNYDPTWEPIENVGDAEPVLEEIKHLKVDLR